MDIMNKNAKHMRIQSLFCPDNFCIFYRFLYSMCMLKQFTTTYRTFLIT